MARRIINPAATGEGEGEQESMPGGAPGIPEEKVVVVDPPKLERDPVELAKLPAVKLYRVANSKSIVYGGVPTLMRHGKTVSEATHDLHSLRAQGVILEEVPHGS